MNLLKIAGVASLVSRAALRYATGRFLPLSRSWQFSCPCRRTIGSSTVRPVYYCVHYGCERRSARNLSVGQ
ncbi:hypothetical protein N657DRAFT_640349 [Parathielavia appendiculata]|uniref:Uncharacterized protein n=1 Tax=Parathielavia appendiculata TaxID=2587402 RepID=A0AAN6Z9B0_9PEZI|nr:hypothetical protein N657DRAFT_640349 [Parathielavia appendiculata]